MLDRQFGSLGEETSTPVPDDELIATLSGSFSIEKLSFVKDRQVDKFKRTEDFTIGRKSKIKVGRAGFPVKVGVER